MRRFALLVISLVLTFTLLAISAPPSEAVPFPSHQSTATKLEIGGVFDQIDSLLSSLDQIDSLLNNFTTDLNSLIPQQTTPPSVNITCLLYTSDAADDLLCVDLGGRRIIKKKKK